MTSWGETQLAVARDFQEHAVPRYRQPFPRLRAGYYGRREGRALTYDEYVAAVERRYDRSSRDPRLHACRTRNHLRGAAGPATP